jgi:hypothetical protein
MARKALAVMVSVAVALLLTGSRAVVREPLWILQLNLCNSGIAGCYTGRSVSAAATAIRTERPAMVTLNEICQADLAVLETALHDAHPAGAVAAAFVAAPDRRTNDATRCRNGQPFGIGLLVHVPVATVTYTVRSGLYPTQDTSDPEIRAWLCVYVPGRLLGCTTHLASTSPPVALTQCRFLLDSVIPAVRAQAGGYEPTVLGADLNLALGRSPDVRSCVPPGYLRRDDGSVQHVLATADFAVGDRRLVDLAGATDHPGLLVSLTGPASSTASTSANASILSSVIGSITS